MRHSIFFLVFACSVSSGGQRLSDEAAAPVLDQAKGTGGSASGVAPIANAGPDLEVARGESVTLDGRRSFHTTADSFSFRWSQVDDNAAVTLSNPAAKLASFTAPAQTGILRFRLTVTSVDGRETTDETNVYVVSTPPRQAPTLVVSENRILAAGSAAVVKASPLRATDTTPITWKPIAGEITPLTTSGDQNQNLSVSPQQEGIVVLAAETTAYGLSSAPAFVVLNVKAAESGPTAAAAPATSPDNFITQPRIVTTEPGKTIALNDQITGTAASAWTQLSGDPVDISLATGWVFDAPLVPQTLAFVYSQDTSSLTASRQFLLVDVVEPALAGLSADAGPDAFAHEGNTVELNATASTGATGSILQWQQTAGPSGTLSSYISAKPTFTAPSGPATLIFSLYLSLKGGRTPSDSTVVTVLPNSINTAPNGSIEALAGGPGQYTLNGKVSDREFDPFTCNWAVLSGDGSVAPTTGLSTMLSVQTPPVTAKITCCDSLGACEPINYTAN